MITMRIREHYWMTCLNNTNDADIDDQWMACLNNSNDADIDDCVGQYVFENGIWNGKGLRYPELCFLSTRQTGQATQSTQALGSQKGILESIAQDLQEDVWNDGNGYGLKAG